MTVARDAILARVRHALRDVPGSEQVGDVPVERAYRRGADGPATDRLKRFAARVRDYGAEVETVDPESVGEAVTAACERLGLRRVVVPTGLPSGWRPRAGEVIEDAGLSTAELDAVDAALTGCAVAIAETGTIALDGQGASGRRAITLVPDHHICVITSDQVVALVPEAIAALSGPVRRDRAPVTLISGPSASSDIELSRVEGVHGPRNLVVLLAG